MFYVLFSNLPCMQFKLERPSTEKLKFKHIDGVFGIFWFFDIHKTRGFEFVKIYPIPTITTKHVNIFCY